MVEEFFPEEIFWAEALPVYQSAFHGYTTPIEGLGLENSAAASNRRNMNKRMIELLRAIPTGTSEIKEKPEKDRCYRHMINERFRREKQKQNYEALHSMLPPGTKNDKNSIIRKAAIHVQELQVQKEELQRRNMEIETNLAAKEGEKAEVATIRVRVGNPSSAIDSIIEVLGCLKIMKLKAKMIQSEFSALEFSAILEIETQVEVAEVEKVVQRALMEVERKLAFNFLEA
ncbi:hypothetical protein HHK36_026844 [Tetracentron sinense]|uniref:BHLH domain-containing protein n=1 Tax=Tetracentron sinense TaxID=13715 RepID=A0A834YK65_TETSI|nr:hypothetical protein HHK36_026844 [Tetracentron sinense]